MNASINKTGKKFAVVTGASSGIGLELAQQFVNHGFDVLIAAENAEIHHTAKALETVDAKVTPVQVDLATPEGVDELYTAIKAQDRPLDAIAINAGVGVSGGFLETDLQDELNMINLNVLSVVHLSKHVLRDMAAQGHGRVLYTASSVSEQPSPYLAVYAATKAFVLSFADAMRYELKDAGVIITALMPGATDTNFFARAGMLDTKVAQSKKDDPADVAAQAFEALMNGDQHIVAASVKSKLMTWANEIMPESAKAAMIAPQTKPGSARH